MKNTAIILLFVFTFVNNVYSQEPEKEIYKPLNGLHLSFGLHSHVPTSGALFPSIGQNNPDVFRQSLSNEWDSPRVGGYFELTSNIGVNRPFFWGYQFSFQAINNDRHHITSNDPNHPEIGNHYYLTKRVSHRAHLGFLEAQIYNWRNFNLYGRGEIGATRYMGQGKVHTIGSPKAIVDKKHRDLVFTGGLGLGLRYQASDRLAFRFMAGYRFETANNFQRKSYYDGLTASISPENQDFYYQEIEEPNDLVRPIRPRNEYLYLQFGIVHHFDGRDFNTHRGERGESTADPNATAKKPILYLYPEEETLVEVSLELTDHEFIFTYPEYQSNGWKVLAEPNGDLTDIETNRKYYSLFWETKGRPFAENIEDGFVVKGKDTRAFLEEKLVYLGLNFKEANEFLIYWLPKMENNKYNAIYFAFEEYEALSKLNITPQPETIIRLMMMFEALDEPIDLNPQLLEKGPERKGFTAVEWGGMEGEFFKKSSLP
jgi:hypothetical protein